MNVFCPGDLTLLKTEQKLGRNDRSRDCKFVEAALNRVITIIHKTSHLAILICFLGTSSCCLKRLEGWLCLFLQEHKRCTTMAAIPYFCYQLLMERHEVICFWSLSEDLSLWDRGRLRFMVSLLINIKG